MLNEKELIILGAGGQTRSLLTLIGRSVERSVVGIYDKSSPMTTGEKIMGVDVVGSYECLPEKGLFVISSGFPDVRDQLFSSYRSNIYDENIIDPSSLLLGRVEIGSSNHIFSRVVINSEVEIQNNNLFNTGCIVEHESLIGSNNHIAIGAKICGRVTIGSNCYIGAGAVIIGGISICDNVVIGAGAVVVKNILEPGTWVGVPARLLDR